MTDPQRFCPAGVDERPQTVKRRLRRRMWALTCCGYVVDFDDLNEGDMPNSDGSSQLHGICSKCGAGYTVSISDEHP